METTEQKARSTRNMKAKFYEDGRIYFEKPSRKKPTKQQKGQTDE